MNILRNVSIMTEKDVLAVWHEEGDVTDYRKISVAERFVLELSGAQVKFY